MTSLANGLEIHLSIYVKAWIPFYERLQTRTRDFNAPQSFHVDRQGLNKNNPIPHCIWWLLTSNFTGMGMDTLVSKEMVRVDDYTVKFVLNQPEALFVANLANGLASIFQKEQADVDESVYALKNWILTSWHRSLSKSSVSTRFLWSAYIQRLKTNWKRQSENRSVLVSLSP